MQVSKARASKKPAAGTAATNLKRARAVNDVGESQGASDVFEFCPSDDDDAPMVSASNCVVGKRKVAGRKAASLSGNSLNTKAGRVSVPKKDLVPLSCVGDDCDDEHFVDIDISEADSDVVGGGAALGHDFDGSASADASRDELVASCAAEYFAMDSLHKDTEAEDLLARMMDNPDQYREQRVSPAASLQYGRSGCQALHEQDQSASTKHCLVAKAISGCTTPVSRAIVATTGEASAYPPGSELRLRAKRPNEPIRSILKDVFGFDDFRDKQEDVINLVLNGQSCLCVFLQLYRRCVWFPIVLHRYVAPTGCGKSLTFQLPAFKMDGLIVVISPLLVLMHDQVCFFYLQNFLFPDYRS
jgi:hypothetical protein